MKPEMPNGVIGGSIMNIEPYVRTKLEITFLETEAVITTSVPEYEDTIL